MREICHQQSDSHSAGTASNTVKARQAAGDVGEEGIRGRRFPARSNFAEKISFFGRFAVILFALIAPAWSASAEDDARTKQLRLLCAQLSGDLTDPGGLAAFRRCLTGNPIDEIRRSNNIGPVVTDRADAVPPPGYGRNSRRFLGDGVIRFQAAGGLLYAIAADRKLWRWTLGTEAASVVDQDVTAFQVTGTHLFVLTTNGKLWHTKSNGSERKLIDQTATAFHAIDESLIYVLGTDGKLWRELGDFTTRTLVDHSVAAFQAIDASVVYVLDTDQRVWREAGGPQPRLPVAERAIAFQYIPDGDTAYVQTGDTALWRRTGNGKSEQIDTSVAAFQAVDMHLLYVLGKDGRLWRVPGSRDHAELVDYSVLITEGNATFQVEDPSHIYVLGADHKLWAESMPAAR